ncbi:hypothetical protein METBIDRAFT_43864 [Metschnikowia bicuspidata var. bicuspidata NRRL YB-4993]|uniref:Uncharacterized protein n=1 Tax=Metschnikowia bicuspidata var. bicuspidata NRRL YB-4993 TaxID=869754 RepID=A0A1A0H9F2_9ASCO|nr:hypothetical protein METBIDRAFT_43864 [Metschnikowia bicuspidata var. bicuspidata NRRL YB-4993]OBA20749.1 hypothetical protein METBIDRAFT_43864 [Metschnikowia bicuspidata var. bicuspidata NRRL YB-4993]
MVGHTTPRGVPQTPPSSTRKSFGNKPVPKFQLPDLQTPATTRKKPGLLTPDALAGPAHGTTLFPPSPDFTPRRSPRSKRKKLSFERILPPTESFNALLPNHGLVGSGRKHASTATAQPKLSGVFGLAEIFEINNNLDFEQDLPDSPSKRGRPRKQVPETPGKQLITEEKVHSWHGNAFRASFSSDEDESDAEATSIARLANPFLESKDAAADAPQLSRGHRQFNPFSSDKSAVDYSTHMELINHRTGERKVEVLLEEQRKFKPKKLNFSGI